TTAVVCNLDQLPRVLLFRDRSGGSIFIRFLVQFSQRLTRSHTLGPAQPPYPDPGIGPVGRGVVLESCWRKAGPLPVEYHAGSGYGFQPDIRVAATSVW